MLAWKAYREADEARRPPNAHLSSAIEQTTDRTAQAVRPTSRATNPMETRKTLTWVSIS
jgi:hypothetical protein